MAVQRGERAAPAPTFIIEIAEQDPKLGEGERGRRARSRGDGGEPNTGAVTFCPGHGDPMPVDSRAPRGPVSEAPPRRNSTQRSAVTGDAILNAARPPLSRPQNTLGPLSSVESEAAPIHFAAQTDVGNTRDHNEDNFLVDRKLRLYVVCDGMGG